MQIVLASTSRYRQEIIARLGLPFHAEPPVCDETPLPGETALETAVRLARTKAQSLAEKHPQALIIGSDQVALLDGQQIGKPGSFDNGVKMLQWMSGRTVVFHSALALYNSAERRLQEAVGITRVTLRALSDAQIRNYLEREPDALHCAGSAKSEGLGGALLERVESDDPNALIGVPLFKLITMLANEGVEIFAMSGTLFLIPAPLGDESIAWLPEAERAKVLHLTHFVVEAEKTARKHLKALGINTPIRELAMSTLNEHTAATDVAALLQPLLDGHDLGLISEAGCPAVADPGAQLVALAHERGVRVEPLIGPSSILLALMASGANGQCFAFHGYLPVDAADKAKIVKELEQRSRQRNETQVFIETPYRNNALLQQLRDTLSPATRLAVACDLTLPSQTIVSRRVKDWPKDAPDLHKRPAIFIIHAA